MKNECLYSQKEGDIPKKEKEKKREISVHLHTYLYTYIRNKPRKRFEGKNIKT
jgi:hypothetical protein